MARAITPQQVATAVAMREAGYTIIAVAEAIGVSISTIQRHLRSAHAMKGAARRDLVDAARQSLMDRVVVDQTVRNELAKLIADDLAHAANIRSRIALAAEQLVAKDLRDAVLVMRAAAAYSTAIKNTSDMLRHVMRTDRVVDNVVDISLPELHVRELSDSEIISKREAERADDLLMT